jgi:15-cis-phytoene synthase
MSSLRNAQLVAAYRYCRKLNAQHGRTFFLATALLPSDRRPHVHALYGFARYADDLVDHPLPGRPPVARLAELRDDVEAAFAGRDAGHPVVRALADTVRKFEIEQSYIYDFLDSMATDLEVSRYPTFTELRRYMWGSAAVIGLQLLPILGVDGDHDEAERSAADLGIAFQLTNFIRDLGEDYRRGRIYLPEQSLIAHGVKDEMLSEPIASTEVRSLVAAEIERARTFYQRAEPGIALLAKTARDCVRTAYTLYGDILAEVERGGYDVLRKRAVVPIHRRARVGAAGYLHAVRTRRS